MPVAVSTVLSIHRDLAGGARVGSPGSIASIPAVSAANAARTSGRAALRHREGHVDRRNLVDGRKRPRRRPGGTTLPTLTIAMLMRPEIGATDRAIAELDLEALEHGLVGIRQCTRDVDLGLRVVEGDDRGGVLGDQFGVARDVARRLLELRLGAGDHRLHALHLRLDRAAVEHEQHVALVDPRAVGELHIDDFAVDPGLIATLAMVVTVPSASRRTGTDCFTATATATGTVRWLARGACAEARCEGEPFQAKHSRSRDGKQRSHPDKPRSFLHLALSARVLQIRVLHSLSAGRPPPVSPIPFGGLSSIETLCYTSRSALIKHRRRAMHQILLRFETAGVMVHYARLRSRQPSCASPPGTSIPSSSGSRI